MHHHRSTSKGAKPSSGSSKRAASKGRVETGKSGGREGVKNKSRGNSDALSRHDRLNTLKMQRETKREEILYKKRLGAEYDGERPLPPKVVVLIAFHTSADTLSLKRQMLSVCGQSAESVAALPPHTPATMTLPNWAQGPAGCGRPRVLLLDPPRDLMAVLDAAKCADTVLCVLGPHASLEEPSFDALGYKLLTALKSQGLPIVFGAVHGSDEAMASGKKHLQAQKFVTRYFSTELGAETKLYQAQSDEELKVLLRGLASSTPKDLSWRAERGYMLAQEAEYSSADGVLSLRGYARGPGFNCQSLVHLTGHGDFVVESVSTLPDPCPAGASGGSSASTSAPMEGGGERSVDRLQGRPEPDQLRLQPYDPTMEEQTWPTIEEELAAQGARAARRTGVRAALISAPGKESTEASSAGDSMEVVDGEGAGAEDGEASDDDGTPSVAAPSIAETDGEAWDVSSNMTMDVPSSEAVAAEKRRREVLMKRTDEEFEFPDEIDTPLEVPAKARFQKYRGLKSFRTSNWDPYEELPLEYSRIWEFEAFTSTAKYSRQQYAERCAELEGDGVSALYCCIRLRGVQPSVLESQMRGSPFVLSGLFDCEQKVSVIHAHVSRLKDYTEPIKSKQELIMHAGFRRFSAKATFSEIPRKSSAISRKFKFSRYLQQGAQTCASFYAPVVFPPCRLLMSVATSGEPGALAAPELVAGGSVVSVDPKQLIIKRIILTGYPFRTQKAKGVIRFMFFNPSDIRWFKPVELTTKKGLRGHISEPLGTHGYMKCRFSAYIQQDDTVCMHLYKRVYPKWFPPAWGGLASAGPEDA
ncbi:unnamed protein product [Polarella glacialis]|uniref:Bms1-type G domain-containing protein n=1 Tax=Polarella glacialis TaxID=89957 RepID=A0A813HFU1_POLGL|nr:unnamed protein product [Polarella glacialis]|mmetsp:Transcript_40115/g.72649  ORF Transcript_40115/g.72649 Transcript_40115/m.72649 type:complete len:813 (-) Transcript_40115:58-2496(-)